MKRFVGIGDYVITNIAGDEIVTHALGSCVAVTFYNADLMQAAMIHIALPQRPESTSAHSKIGYYADTGLNHLINEVQKRFGIGITKYQIHVIGGADPIKENDFFQIGKRNLTEVMNILNRHKLHFYADEISGNVSRSVNLCVRDGKISITKQPLII